MKVLKGCLSSFRSEIWPFSKLFMVRLGLGSCCSEPLHPCVPAGERG